MSKSFTAALLDFTDDMGQAFTAWGSLIWNWHFVGYRHGSKQGVKSADQEFS